MPRLLRPAGSCVLAALSLVAVPSAVQAQAPPPAQTFTVDSTADATDSDTGTGGCETAANTCTLRAAIQEANVFSNADTIIVPAGIYNLTLGGSPEDTAFSGDLDITQPVTLSGAGAATTVVDQDVGGERVFDVQLGSPNTAVEIIGTTVTGGSLGGIRTIFTSATPRPSLTLTASEITGNTRAAGVGGGIDANTGPLILNRTTVSENSAPAGGGISLADGAVGTITNSTISGNAATAAGAATPTGGGGIRLAQALTNGTPSATLINTTVRLNTAAAGTGGGLRRDANNNLSFTLKNTIVANSTGNNCQAANPAPPLITSQGHNIDNANTCGLSQPTDKVNTDPQLGALANNGGGTRTHAIPASSPAVDAIAAADCPPPTADQRNIARPLGPACDIGAFEFAAPPTTVATIPDCSPSGTIPLEMTTQAGQHPEGFHYKVNDGPTQDVATTGKTASLSLPEGQYKLEYWSDTQEGGEGPAADHQIGTAIVDQTDPNVAIKSDQGQSLYVITRQASVTVEASDALSGLAAPPPANQQVPTNSRGAKNYAWTAEDLCGNQATGQFNYTVLGPGIGERAVIEPLGDGVLVALPDAGGAGARASQKGEDFVPVTQPREIPIGSTIDARGGEARITSSESAAEGEIQDGAFTAGIFQVLQSRTAARGLTELRLKGSNFKNCQVGKASASRLSRRARRRLRANANGRFRTRGRHSAATVRGTEWTVVDRCDGTLTTVTRGSVAVRDFRLQQTITLTRGRSYLALAEPPAPKLGKTFNVRPVKGKVFIKLPNNGRFARASQKGSGFVRLTTARSIPVRSILDTTKGTVSLRTARNRQGRLQSGRFAGGVFQVLQSRKREEKGLTRLRLKGSAAKFKRCGSSASGVRANASRLSRRAIRRLRGRARGRYRTRGRHSAATVRGTVWTVTDRCDGTLTTVKRGKVAVRDFRLQKRVILTAGKRYLARPPE